MNLLTAIVLVVFVLCMLRGYRKGFVKSLVSMVSLIASLILVAFVSPYVTDFLKTQTPVYEVVQEKCKETFRIESTIKKEAAEERNQQSELIENLPVPAVFKNMLKENNTPETYKELAVDSFNEYVPEFMTNLFMNIISFILTWILVMLVIGIVSMVLDLITSLPLIHGLNQILGLVLGFVQATIIVWIGMLVITIFSNSAAGRQLMEMISESEILKMLYQTNLILDFLQNTVGKIF